MSTAVPLVLNLCDVDVELSFTPKPPKNNVIPFIDKIKDEFFCSSWKTCSSPPSKPTDSTVPSSVRGSADSVFAPPTIPAGANGNIPVMYASALSVGYAGGIRQDLSPGQWFLDNTRVKDVGMLQYADSGGQMYLVFFPPIAGQPVLSSVLSWGASTLPTVGSTVSSLIQTAVAAAQSAPAAAGGAPASPITPTSINAWNAGTLQVTLNGTAVPPTQSTAGDFTALPVVDNSVVFIGDVGSMVFGGGSADIPVAMWITAGTIPQTQVDVIVWSSPSGVDNATASSTTRTVTAYVADNTADTIIPYTVAKWVNTHHLESMLPTTASALATGGQPSVKCSDTSTPPPANAPCSSTGRGTCVYTPYALTNDSGAACSLYNTKEYGKYCRAQAAAQGAAGDADIEKACAACQDGSGKCTSDCPPVCTALYPACATSTMYIAGSDGSSSYPMQFTPATFANAFIASNSGAVPPDIKVRRGTTAAQALEAIKEGLLNNLECWWPQAVSAAQDVQDSDTGVRFAQGGGMNCDGLLLTSKLRAKYGKAPSTCPASVNGMPTNCGSLVAKAMSDAVAHGTDGVKMTQLQTWLMTKACGIDAGVAEPPGLPHERKWPLLIGLGVAGLAVLLLIAAIIVRLAKHKKARSSK